MSPTFAPISAGGVGRATVNGTSGSPTVNTNARPGKTIYEFNGSGSITIGTAGYAEIAVIGGGASGLAATFGFYDSSTNTAPGGGGGGGVYQDTEYFFNSGSKSITVGAGGASTGNYVYQSYSGGGQIVFGSYPGSASAIGNILVPGGGLATSSNSLALGNDSWSPSQANWVVCSGGGYYSQQGTRPYNIGNSVFLGAGALGGIQNGGAGRGAGGGGGGPSAGSGGNATNNSTGNGGSGTTVNITGSAVVYGGGGAGGNDGSGGSGGGAAGSTSASANTGGGGGGGGNARNGATTNAGGSGKVIVVIG